MAAFYENEKTLQNFHDFYDGYYAYGDLDRKTKTLQEIGYCLDAIERHHGGGSGKATGLQNRLVCLGKRL